MRKSVIVGLSMLGLVLVGCQSAERTPQIETVVDEQVSVQAAWPLLKVGSRGSQVSAAQYLLKAHGIHSGGKADGIFGQNTKKAIQEFQRNKGLGADGVVGKNTWQALIITVKRGHKNKEAVKAVQVLVGVKADGAFGPNTEKAVKNFQRDKKLSVDGIVGKNTWRALLSGGSSGGGSTRAQLASMLLRSDKVSFAKQGDTYGASPFNTIKRTAAGKKVRRGCHYDANCKGRKYYIYLQPSMLRGVLKMAEISPYKFQVNSTSGGVHSRNSRHYVGLAIDINRIDGRRVVNNQAFAKRFMKYCRKAGASKVLGPGHKGHHHHLHCEWR